MLRRILLPVLAIATAFRPPGLAAQTEPVVVYLVRHAERGEDTRGDPPITAEGQERARLLASILRDAGITHVHTTDYRRTRDTARPLANAAGLSLETYEADDLASFADLLRATPGRHLVVGHSDTTPELVALLGGDPGPPIADPEYDRLYVLVLANGRTTTLLLRYGRPFR